MKTKLRPTLLLAAAFATAAWLATPLPAQNNRNDREAEAALQAAINREVVDGNLSAAIEQYTKVIATHANSRAVAAKALYHLGQAHEKLGSAEARKAYERIARDFADQKDVVADAGRRLAALTGATASARPSSSLVWKDEKANFEGTVSLDGRYISFIDWDTGDLAMHEVATGQNRIITETKNEKNKWTAFAEESAISRDGRQVAYSWWTKEKDRYELRVANLSGDPNPRLVYDHPNVKWMEPRDWSPDDKWIAVMISLKVPTKDGSDQLGLVSVADGSMRLLRSGTWSGNSRVIFSPDGKYLGYDLPQRETKERDVWVTATDGSGESAVAAHRSNDAMVGWSPDGKRLLFCSDRTGSTALWSITMSAGTPHGAPEMIKADMGQITSLGVTRTGALFYGSGTRRARGGTIHVASFDLRTGKVTSSRDVSDNYLEDNFNPCWSPDGKYLAYGSDLGRPGKQQEFVIRSIETDHGVRVLPHKLRNILLLGGWMADGRGLLATGTDDRGRTGLFRVDGETGDLDLLVESPSGTRLNAPIISPDGRKLYYQRRTTAATHDVLILRDLPSGTEKEVLRSYLGGLGGMILSPDGNFLAMPGADPTRNERLLLIIPLQGGQPREVMRIPSNAAADELQNHRRGSHVSAAGWAADSRSFIARRHQAYESEGELWDVPVDGGTPRKLEASLEAQVGKFTFSADGQRVAYRKNDVASQTEGQKEIWVLENFLTTK